MSWTTPSTKYTLTHTGVDRTSDALTAATLTDSSTGSANTTVAELADVSAPLLLADAAALLDVNARLNTANDNFADVVAQINALVVDVTNIKDVLTALLTDLMRNRLIS